MIKKRKGKLIVCIILALGLIIIYLNQPVETTKEIRHNISHKEEDINKVMDKAIEEFTNMNTKVYNVYYDENMSYEEEQRCIRKYENSQEVIILYLDFKTGFFDVSPGFGTNQHYVEYSYVASKTKTGSWKFVDGGYG